MKRITVDEIKGIGIFDVYYTNSRDYKGIQELKEDLNYMQALEHIDYLITKYEMSDNDLMKAVLYNESSNLFLMDKMTVKEYKELLFFEGYRK